MAEPLLHTTGATTGANQQAYDADGNPIGSLAGALAVQLFHNGNPYQATFGDCTDRSK